MTHQWLQGVSQAPRWSGVSVPASTWLTFPYFEWRNDAFSCPLQLQNLQEQRLSAPPTAHMGAMGPLFQDCGHHQIISVTESGFQYLQYPLTSDFILLQFNKGVLQLPVWFFHTHPLPLSPCGCSRGCFLPLFCCCWTSTDTKIFLFNAFLSF